MITLDEFLTDSGGICYLLVAAHPSSSPAIATEGHVGGGAVIVLNVALNGWKNEVSWYGVPFLKGILEGISALLLSSLFLGDTDGGGCGNKF